MMRTDFENDSGGGGNNLFRMIDLFSGIGGFSLAAQWAFGEKLEIVTFCENNVFCQKVLRKNFPGVPIRDNIKTMSGKEYESIDIITGGFPCTPFSVAGKQRGTQDDRYLWPEMYRIIKEVKPRWVIGENVTGIIEMALDDVLVDLENEGYETQAIIIPACAVNAPHRRDRIWILAYTSNNGCVASTIGEGFNQTNDGNMQGEKKTGNIEGCSGLWINVANANCTRLGKRESIEDDPGTQFTASQRDSRGFNANTHKQHDDNGGSRTSEIQQQETARVQDSKQWEFEPRVGRVVDGLPDRVDRIKALGNAIVPQVACRIFQCIKIIEERGLMGGSGL